MTPRCIAPTCGRRSVSEAPADAFAGWSSTTSSSATTNGFYRSAIAIGRTLTAGRTAPVANRGLGKGATPAYLDEHVHFPNIRIEYEDRNRSLEREDIEVTTGHYRGAHAAAARGPASRDTGASAASSEGVAVAPGAEACRVAWRSGCEPAASRRALAH